jgi:hypothetical protein
MKKRSSKKLSSAAAAAEEKFKRDVLIRGEAAPLDPDGKLPLNATHEIVAEDPKDPTKAKIVRRRFKLY